MTPLDPRDLKFLNDDCPDCGKPVNPADPTQKERVIFNGQREGQHLRRLHKACYDKGG